MVGTFPTNTSTLIIAITIKFLLYYHNCNCQTLRGHRPWVWSDSWPVCSQGLTFAVMVVQKKFYCNANEEGASVNQLLRQGCPWRTHLRFLVGSLRRSRLFIASATLSASVSSSSSICWFASSILASLRARVDACPADNSSICVCFACMKNQHLSFCMCAQQKYLTLPALLTAPPSASLLPVCSVHMCQIACVCSRNICQIACPADSSSICVCFACLNNKHLSTRMSCL